MGRNNGPGEQIRESIVKQRRSDGHFVSAENRGLALHFFLPPNDCAVAASGASRDVSSGFDAVEKVRLKPPESNNRIEPNR